MNAVMQDVRDLVMYESTLRLRTALPTVMQVLTDCHALHQWVMTAFPSGPSHGEGRQAHGVLYALEVSRHAPVALLTVRSATAPSWTFVRPAWLAPTTAVPTGVRVSSVDAQSLTEGMRVGFRLVANVTVCNVPHRTQARRKTRRPLRDIAGIEAWAHRRFAVAGLAIEPEELACAAHPWIVGARQGLELPRALRAPDLSFHAVRFSGTAVVRDVEACTRAMRDGVGPGKAYGLGLLQLMSLDG